MHFKRYSFTVFEKQNEVRLDLMNHSSIKAKPNENKDEYNFLSQHLLMFHFIFIYLHGKSETGELVPITLKSKKTEHQSRCR